MSGMSLADAQPSARGGTARASKPLLDQGGVVMLAILAGGFIAPALTLVAWGGAMDTKPGQSLELRMLVWSVLPSLLLPVLRLKA